MTGYVLQLTAADTRTAIPEGSSMGFDVTGETLCTPKTRHEEGREVHAQQVPAQQAL